MTEQTDITEQPATKRTLELAWIMTVEHRRGKSEFQGVVTINPGTKRLEVFAHAKTMIRPKVRELSGGEDFAVLFFDLGPNDPFGGAQ